MHLPSLEKWKQREVLKSGWGVAEGAGDGGTVGVGSVLFCGGTAVEVVEGSVLFCGGTGVAEGSMLFCGGMAGVESARATWSPSVDTVDGRLLNKLLLSKSMWLLNKSTTSDGVARFEFEVGRVLILLVHNRTSSGFTAPTAFVVVDVLFEIERSRASALSAVVVGCVEEADVTPPAASMDADAVPDADGAEGP